MLVDSCNAPGAETYDFRDLLYYIYAMVSFFFHSFSYSSPNLSGRRLDVYHTSTHGVALV